MQEICFCSYSQSQWDKFYLTCIMSNLLYDFIIFQILPKILPLLSMSVHVCKMMVWTFLGQWSATRLQYIYMMRFILADKSGSLLACIWRSDAVYIWNKYSSSHTANLSVTLTIHSQAVERIAVSSHFCFKFNVAISLVAS